MGRLDESIVPLWWRPEFLGAQDVPIHSFRRGRVTIPFVHAAGKIEVGLAGPYSGAYAAGFGHTADEVLSAWDDFVAGTELPILVRLPPESHFPVILRQNLEALRYLGADFYAEETNHTIHLDEEAVLPRNRRRHLRSAENLGMRVVEASVPEACAVLRANRSAKNYRMSLSEEQIGRLSSRIPGSIECFTAVDQGNAIAASITFLVSPDIDYVFMWGGDPRAQNNSEALTLLASHIIARSTAIGRKRLCLGTSSFSGTVNEGLARFKESLGARREPKRLFFIPRGRGSNAPFRPRIPGAEEGLHPM